MKKCRLLAILLAAVLLLNLFPVVSAEETEAAVALNYTAADAAFAAIDAALDSANAKKAASNHEIAIAKAAVESLGYEVTMQGSDRFVWVADGVPCAYSARLQEIARNAKPIEGYVDDGQVVTVDYSSRSNGPNSKDVVLIEPYYGLDSSFSQQYQAECSSIAAATGGTYTLYKTTNATIDAIADALESAAVVVFDSHGDTDYAKGEDYTTGATTSYICLQSGTGITAADQRLDGSTYHAQYAGSSGSMKYYMVDGTAIANHLEAPLPNNLVWMAICLGMATDGLEGPFMENGAGVVYGYSQSVTFDGDYKYEASFWTEMKNGAKVAEAIAAMKEKYGNWDPYYKGLTLTQAKREKAAFPIVVSAMDAYPGHGNVDAYQTVYSDWELFEEEPSYTVTAEANNAEYGTVTLSGNTITALPNPGYQVSGYTVSPQGACTVQQKNNLFTVSGVISDCTVVIHFVPRATATVAYAVPEGVSCPPMQAYVDDQITLPAPSGVPTDEAHSYRFLGWVETDIGITTEFPELYRVGSSLSVAGDMTLYPVYAFTAAGSSVTGGAFTQVTEEPLNWEGEYVLSYQGETLLDASGKHTGVTVGAKEAAIDLSDTGIFLNGSVMDNVADEYVFVVTQEDGGDYSIRMKGSQTYLAFTGSVNSLTTANSAGDTGALWKISMNGAEVRIENVNTAGRCLQYNPSTKLFRCYFGIQKDLTLFSAVSGTVWYTTLSSAVSCDHAWDEGTVTAAPDCTQQGSVTYTCLICGETKTEIIPSLPCPSLKFTDVDTAKWYHKAVDFVVSLGIMTGTSDSTFEPEAGYSRAMIVNMLYRLEGAPAVSGSATYSDVPADQWYSTAIAWAKASGIVSGYPDGTFGPNDEVTREQIAAILYRYVKYKGGDVSAVGDLSHFADASAISAYAVDTMGWAVGAGIISGTDKGMLNPRGNASRAEAAQMFMNLLKN